MASVNARSARPRKPAKQAPKTVMPAIPLPYVKRQAAAAAATAPAAPAAAQVPTTIEPEENKHNSHGTREISADNAERASPVFTEATPHATESLLANGPESNHVNSADTSSQQIDVVGSIEPLPTTNGPTVAGSQATANHTGITPVGAIGLSKAEDPAPQAIPEPPTESPTKFHGTAAAAAAAAAKSEPQPKSVQHPSTALVLSQPPPSRSPTRYQMPPPFQPANLPMGIVANGDMSRGHRPPMPNGPPHMHQAHPSNGSVHFGAFHDSQSSSPAPPHSGGIAPPPGMPVPDGRPPHMVHHSGSGFPPMMPYGAEMMPVTSFDNYGRPAVAYGPMDSYPPFGNTLGPSTPHSFHDSQSSAHAEDGGMYNQYPPGALRNGTAGPGDDVQVQNHQGRMFGPPEYPPMMPNPGLPPHMMSPGDNADGLLGYLQQQFASPELADCTLELRYTDDRAAPVRIPGHRFIFARSFQLFNLLRKQAFQASPTSLQTLLLETESKWIRSDSFYMAVQRLYGLPLLHTPPRRNGMESGDVTDAGSVNDQFDFAISYAAAGHLLDWSAVIRRGCEVATHLLGWQTLERALEFALDGYSDKGTHEAHKYGEGSGILLNAIVTFIVHNFPSHFNLDNEAAEPLSYARLPAHPPLPSMQTPTVPKAVVPAPIEASSVQLGRGRRPQKLSGIQFGDMSFTEGKNGSVTETPKATRQAQPVSYTILARILPDIPFTQLKMILESSGSGNVNGWANAESRYRIIKAAVDEREARRHRALEAVLADRVPDAEMIRAGLRSPEPRDLGRWNALGWQEEMLPYGNADGPCLARKWVPLMEPQSGSVAEYP